MDQEDREYFLKKALQKIRNDFDFVFIDCPPSLGLLTINGLTAAQNVIIPLQCEYFALEGLKLLLQTIETVQNTINSTLKIGGILFTMYDVRTRLAHEVVQEVTTYFKDKVFIGCRIEYNPKLSPKKRFYFIDDEGNDNYLNYKIYPNIYYYNESNIESSNQSNETKNLLSGVKQ